jgi:hypothetical protein
VVHHEVLGLSGGVALNRYDNAGRLALDLTLRARSRSAARDENPG